MRLPLVVTLLGYAGLIPFLIGPLWLTASPATVPLWLGVFWTNYATLLAAFLAGTFWGFTLPAAQGPNGLLGMLIASFLMLLTWLSMALPFATRLALLTVVFLLLLIADFWRERTLDTLPGYFRLRAMLTVGAVAAIGWRLALL